MIFLLDTNIFFFSLVLEGLDLWSRNRKDFSLLKPAFCELPLVPRQFLSSLCSLNQGLETPPASPSHFLLSRCFGDPPKEPDIGRGALRGRGWFDAFISAQQNFIDPFQGASSHPSPTKDFLPACPPPNLAAQTLVWGLSALHPPKKIPVMQTRGHPAPFWGCLHGSGWGPLGSPPPCPTSA